MSEDLGELVFNHLYVHLVKPDLIARIARAVVAGTLTLD